MLFRLTPGDKGQALLLVWCPQIAAYLEVCPWRSLKNLYSEPMEGSLDGFCPQIILRGVQVYNQEIRVTVPDTGGEKNTI